MNLFQQFQQAFESPTTTKILCSLVIGNSAAYLLRSGNSTTIGITAGFLCILAINVTANAYHENRNRQLQDQPPKPADTNKRNQAVFVNSLLTLLLFTTLSMWK